MGDDTAELALKAAAWGVLSAISLVIGAVIGVVRNPKKEIRAMLMAYGSGALIEALSIELFAHIVHMANESCKTSDNAGSHRRLAEGGDCPGKSLVYVAMAMALLGGSIFAGLNKVLNDAGGFARHATSLKEHVGKRRLIFYTRLETKLKSVPMLANLKKPELRALAAKMKKDVFMAGEHIFYHGDLHPPMYFLMSGSVRVDICVGQEQRSDLPLTPLVMKNSHATHTEPLFNTLVDSSQEKLVSVIVEKPRSAPSGCLDGQDVHFVGASEDSYYVSPGQLFGELSLITGQPLRANAVAATDSKVLKMLTHDFIDLVEENPQIRQFLGETAGHSMNNTSLFDEDAMESLIGEMELLVFAADEIIYTYVDETTPIYYLVLGHVGLSYESAADAFPSRQDAMQASKRRIIRPGKVFGSDNLLTGKVTSVTAVAHDRSLVLCLHREDILRFGGLNEAVEHSRSFVHPIGEQDRQQSAPAWARSPNSPGKSPAAAPVADSETSSIEEVVLPPACITDCDDSQNVSPMHSQLRQITTGSEARLRCSDMSDLGGTPQRMWSKATIGSNGSGSDRTKSKADKRGLLSVHMEVTDAEVLEDAKEDDPHGKHSGDTGHNNSHAAIMIWLGILIDAVPESVVLGILSSTSSSASLLTFVIGVFLANLPEAMSSSGTMAACGISRKRILLMWSSIVLLTGVGASMGAILFPPGSEEEESSQYAIAAIEGMCGGAMLTMIANTALPEAFEQGGNVVGLSTLLGFLSALFVSVASS